MKTPIRFKICCIASIQEAQMAIDAGASALGLVGHMPSGPGVISDQLIAEIAKNVPPPIATFLLTSETDPQRIIDHYRRCRTTAIQLVDLPAKGSWEILRNELPGIKLVQVIHVTDESSIQQAVNAAPFIDALLLDSGNPDLQIKELGGTGRTHNWQLSSKIVESVKSPVFLAGGLNATNVSEAIKAVKPFAVDVCSGVRTNGKLDTQKLNTFAKMIRVNH